MLIHLWHSWLDMEKYDQKWHENDISDELAELRYETGIINRWSECSDIVYTFTRAHWAGYKLERPISLFHFSTGLIYMFPKYTLRWCFFKRVGKKLGVRMHEVRNPKKLEKLHSIAERHGVNAAQFEEICRRQLRYWPLLK